MQARSESFCRRCSRRASGKQPRRSGPARLLGTSGACRWANSKEEPHPPFLRRKDRRATHMGKKNLPFRGGLCLRAGQAGRASSSSFSPGTEEKELEADWLAVIALMLNRCATLMVPFIWPNPSAELARALIRSPCQLDGNIMISAAQLDSNTAFLYILHGIGVQ